MISVSQHMTPELEAEVRQWVDQLLASAAKNRQQAVEAASELSFLGVWTRGSVRTRGSLRATAETRLPEPDKLQLLVSCLEDADKGVRCQVALALGEWGGEGAAAALHQMLRADMEEEVQLYCITVLCSIGGPIAVEGLRQAAERGTEAVRNAAIGGIEELATGGQAEYTEAPAMPQPPMLSAARARGALRARGGARTRGRVGQVRREDVVSSVAATLERIRADHTASEYLRQRADEVLVYLME